MENIETLNEFYKKFWWQSSSCMNSSLKLITIEEKRNNEIQLENLLNTVANHIKQFNNDNKLRWKKEFDKIIDSIISDKETFQLGKIDENFKNQFFESTKQFIKSAREFDNTLSFQDIGQALRNVWIINILQGAFGYEAKFSKAIFGYSMLYPYTDNFLDDIKISSEDKIIFNERFSRRLEGEKILPINNHEKMVYSLVENIEEVFNREQYQEVYKSLLKIHYGQVKSLSQQKKNTIPYENDILGISIEKGGASVLVDGYLISGDLDYKQLKFCIGYGFLLQLADDLQDVKEDTINNHCTIMSQLGEKYKLDVIANKLINFTINVVDETKSFTSSNSLEFKKLIKDNCLMLVLFSIILSKEHFTSKYIKEIQTYLPFSIKYIEKIRVNIKKKFKFLKELDQDTMSQLIDTLILD